MNIRSGQSITTEFTTRVFSTGAAANADSLPTGTLYVNGTADAATVTVTNISTGLYKAQVTLPTLAVGDVAAIVIAATVSSVSDKAKIWEGTKLAVVDSAGLVDANTVKVGPSGAGTAQAAGDLYTAIAAIKAKTDNLPSDPADASSIADSFTSISNTLSTIAGYIDTEVTAIKAKTDNLPVDPASAASISSSFAAINSTLSTLAEYIDTEVAAIKAKTDNLPTSPAAVGSEMTLTIAYDAAKTAASQESVDNLPTNAELAEALAGSDDATLAAIAALNNLSAAQVNAECDAAISDAALATNISAIKAKTDNLPSSPAAVGSAMTLTTGERTAIANEVDAPTKAEMDVAFSSLQSHGDDVWAPIGHGEGVNIVTITVLDEDDAPMEGARVTLAVNASRYAATCDVDGVAVLSPDEGDATYEVRIAVDSLHQFTPTNLVVVGDTEETYTVTTLVITPSDDDTYVTGWLIARDEDQNILPNVKHQIRLLAYPVGHVGSSNNDELKESTSNAEGLVTFTNLIPLARYRLNVYGGNSPQEFIAPNSTPFELPSVK